MSIEDIAKRPPYLLDQKQHGGGGGSSLVVHIGNVDPKVAVIAKELAKAGAGTVIVTGGPVPGPDLPDGFTVVTSLENQLMIDKGEDGHPIKFNPGPPPSIN